MNTDKHRFFLRDKSNKIRFLSVFICVHLWLIFLTSCNSIPTDLRSFAPAESLVYLETNDLGKTLENLTQGKAFQQLAKSTPDFSALKNIQVAVVVTGFEASENQVTEENSVLNFKPRFVAIADTHAWNWQTLSFTEAKIGQFVADILNSEVSLTKTDKSGGTLFTWTAQDERKLFAFVQDSKIYFGNDATAIEKCLAVSRGESDSFAKTGKTFERNEKTLAFGYVSSEGIAQISNVAGVSTAIETTENEEGRGFIAGVLSQILKNSVKEIFWTATKTEQGIEDKYKISLTPETASVFKETIVPSIQTEPKKMIALIPSDAFSVTRYNLQNPQIAWRSLLLVAGKNTDERSAKILTSFSGNLLESYSISDAENFLSAVDSEMWTVNFDAESEKSAVVVSFKSDADFEKLKKSIKDIDFRKPAESVPGGFNWTSDNKELAFSLLPVFPDKRVFILGDAESVKKCREANFSYLSNEGNSQYRSFYDKFAEKNNAVALTFGSEIDSAEKVVNFLADLKDENSRITTHFLTETRFNEKGFERKTFSDFGLIGDIIERFSE